MKKLLLILAIAAAFGQPRVTILPRQDNSAPGVLAFRPLFPSTNEVQISSPNSLAATYQLKWPASAPTADGQCLAALTSGQFYFSASVCAEKLVADYDWSKTLGTLSAGPSTLTITFSNRDCPAYGNEAAYVLRVHESLVPTTYELDISNGTGTCTPGGNGTIVVSHGAIAFTTAVARSASGGWQESIFRVPDGYSVHVRAGVGGYDIYSDILTGTRNLHAVCDGEWALLQPKVDNLHIFNIQSPRAATIDGCQVYNGSYAHSGVTAVYFYNPSGNSYGGRVKNMTITSVENAIRLRTGYNTEVTGNTIVDATHAGIWQANAATPDAGTGYFAGNRMSCSVTCDYGLLWEGPGSLQYINNAQNGFTEQVRLEPVGGTSQIKVNDNDFDGGVNTTHGIRWVGAGVIYSVQMLNNIVHSYVTSPAAASGIVIEGGGAAIVQIAGNDLASPPAFGTGFGITITDSDGFKLSNNIVWGWDTGLNIGSGATNIEEEGTKCQGNATACITNASTTAILGPKTPIAFAALPSVAADGSKIFCSDCAPTAGTAVCAGSGSGSNATRIGGAWKCEAGSTDLWTPSGGGVYRATGTVAIGGTPSSATLRLIGPTGGGGSAAVYEQQHGSGTGHFQLTTETSYTLFSNVTNTQMIFATDATARWLISAAGILAPNLTDTYDFGTNLLRVRSFYGKTIDTALAGGTGDSVITRKLTLYDNTGSISVPGVWDLNAVASGVGAAANSNFYIRNNAGGNMVLIEAVNGGGTIDRTTWYTSLRPNSNATKDLGESLLRWDDAFIVTTNTNTLVVNNTVSSSLTPTTTNLYPVGDPTFRWSQYWGVLGNYSGLLTAGGGLTVAGTITFPTGTTGHCWINSGSGVGGWAACATTTAFIQNGNSFGATATLGTNDNQALHFETNGTDRWDISAAGHLIPELHNAYNFGHPSFRAAIVYSVLGDFSGLLTASAGATITGGNSLLMDRATRGTNQKAYWTVAGNPSTTGAWSTGTTPGGGQSRWVIDHNGTEHVTVDESGLVSLSAGLAVTGAASATNFNGTGANPFRVSGTGVIDSSRNLINIGTGAFSGLITAAGGVTVSGVLSISAATVTGDYIPTSNNANTNGTTGNYWNMMRSESIRLHGGNIQPATSGVGTNGASTARWSTTFTQALNFTGTLTPPSGTAFTGTKVVKNSAGANCNMDYSEGIALTSSTC